MDQTLKDAAYDLRTFYEKTRGCNIGMDSVCATHLNCANCKRVNAVWRAAQSTKVAESNPFMCRKCGVAGFADTANRDRHEESCSAAEVKPC